MSENYDYDNVLQLVGESVASGNLSICDLSELECSISVMFKRELRRLIHSIDPRQLEVYMLAKGFRVENKVHGALVWARGNTQALMPTDKSFRDFYRCLRNALEEIAKDDGSGVAQVVDSILKTHYDFVVVDL